MARFNLCGIGSSPHAWIASAYSTTFARRLAAEIEAELATLTALGEEFRHAPPGNDSYSVRARGSMLHDFYNGVEA